MSSNSVKINSSSKAFLKIMSKKANTSQQDYLSTAIDYLYETGLDIYNKKTVNVGDSMKALENRIIGFLKKREQDFFVPMSQKMTALAQSNMDLLKGLETLDVIELISQGNPTETRPEFLVAKNQTRPDSDKHLADSVIGTEEHKAVNRVHHIDSDIHKERADLFKGELTFLKSKIIKGTGLNSGKFIANINQRDMDRINRIINDN